MTDHKPGDAISLDTARTLYDREVVQMPEVVTRPQYIVFTQCAILGPTTGIITCGPGVSLQFHECRFVTSDVRDTE